MCCLKDLMCVLFFRCTFERPNVFAEKCLTDLMHVLFNRSNARVLTRILKIGVKMRYFLNCLILLILYYWDFPKS